MPRKTPPFDRYPAWTVAKFWGFIRSGLREKFNRWPPKYEAIKEAAVTVQEGHYKTGPKMGQPKYIRRYTCALCEQDFMQKEIQVDHILPAGQLRDFEDLPAFVERLFCGKAGLQVVCKPCHKDKTIKEKAE